VISYSTCTFIIRDESLNRQTAGVIYALQHVLCIWVAHEQWPIIGKDENSYTKNFRFESHITNAMNQDKFRTILVDIINTLIWQYLKCSINQRSVLAVDRRSRTREQKITSGRSSMPVRLCGNTDALVDGSQLKRPQHQTAHHGLASRQTNNRLRLRLDYIINVTHLVWVFTCRPKILSNKLAVTPTLL